MTTLFWNPDKPFETLIGGRDEGLKGVSGVYAIVHKDSKKAYIGSAVDLCRRQRFHRSRLRSNRHTNRHLQNAWNKYGENAFSITLLEATSREDTIKVEQKWLDKLRTFDRSIGYNLSPTASSNLGIKHSAEIRAKFSRCLTGRKFSAEARKNIIFAHQGEKSHLAKLTEKMVIFAREKASSGCNIRDLAADLGVSESGLRKAISGNSWSYLPNPVALGPKRH